MRCLFLLLVACCSASAADISLSIYGYTAGQLVRFTGVPYSMPVQSSSNSFSSSILTRAPGDDVSLLVSLGGSNLWMVTNATVALRLGYDGIASNFATQPEISTTVTLSGTNPLVHVTQFTKDQLRGARTVAVSSVAVNQAASLLPSGLDFTGGAAYGFNYLVADYFGPTVRLARDSDGAEADFGVTPLGVLDTNAVNSWLAGSVGRGVVWYDQSGNGNHAVQTTNAARCTFEYSAADGRPVFVGGNLNGNYSRFWKLPVGIAQNPRSFSAFMAYKVRNRYPPHPFYVAMPGISIGNNPGGAGASDGTVSVQNTISGTVIYGHSGLAGKTNGVLQSDTVPEVMALVSSSSGLQTLAGQRIDSFSSGAVARSGSQVPAGGQLGRYGFSLGIAEGEARAYVIARETTVAAARNVAAALAASTSLRSGFTNTLWWVGDSLSAGYQDGFDYRDFSPGHKLAQLTTNYFVRVFAQAGKRIDQIDTLATTASGGTAVDMWAQEFGLGGSRVLLWCGYNDLATGSSLATVQARINTFIANRKTAGFSKVYVGTLIPVGSYISPDSLRTDLNAWLTGGMSDADGVVDFAGLGDWAGKMQPDGVHLLEPAGNAEAARVAKAFLDSL